MGLPISTSSSTATIPLVAFHLCTPHRQRLVSLLLSRLVYHWLFPLVDPNGTVVRTDAASHSVGTDGSARLDHAVDCNVLPDDGPNFNHDIDHSHHQNGSEEGISEKAAPTKRMSRIQFDKELDIILLRSIMLCKTHITQQGK